MKTIDLEEAGISSRCFCCSCPNERGKYCRCSFLPFIIFVILQTALIVAGVTLLVVFLVLIYSTGQSQVQTAINKGNFSFTSLYFYPPTATNVTAINTALLSGSGNFDSTVQSANVSLSYNGTFFGTMIMPDVFLPAFQPLTPINFTTTLQFANTSVAAQILSLSSSGVQVYLRIYGSVNIKVNAFGFSVTYSSITYDKTVALPILNLQPPVAVNVTLVGGNTTHLWAGTSILTNPSVVSTANLGKFVFNLFSWPDKIMLGSVSFQNFQLLLGVSTLPFTAIVMKTPQNLGVLENLLSNYIVGINNTNFISGPINPEQPAWAVNTLQQYPIAVGSTDGPLVLYADVLEANGVTQVLANYLALPVAEENINFYASSVLGISFTTTTGLNCTEPGTLHDIGNLTAGDTATGIPYNFSITVPANGTLAMGIVAIDQTPIPLSCGKMRLLANMCLHQTNTFGVAIAGSFSANISGFIINTVSYSQTLIPTTTKNTLLLGLCGLVEDMVIQSQVNVAN